MEDIDLQRIKNKYDIVGNNVSLNYAIKTAVAISGTDLTAVITGESGVGKDVIPKIIHQNSLRKNGKYFAVNCGAIPEGTIDSELFGHEKGAFTGATETRKGYFEEANQGTLFLDEIGELPLASQAKLLRVLQSGEFMKVGSSKVQKTDVRVIAATNVNLSFAVSQGKFREDLYYRINAIQIAMPSLRDRKDDIYLLFRKFTSDFSDAYGMTKVSLTHKAIEKLCSYRWPGNVRQLKNVTETITALQSQLYSSRKEKIELDEKELQQYMPKEETILLPAMRDEHNFSSPESIFSSADRSMFIKAILDLKQEIDKLKSIVLKPGAKISNEHNYDSNIIRENSYPSKILHLEEENRENETSCEINDDVFTINENFIVGQEPEEQRESEREELSLSKVGEGLIKKALDKNNGNRKLAATELGISERTLYRRLSKNKNHKSKEIK